MVDVQNYEVVITEQLEDLKQKVEGIESAGKKQKEYSIIECKKAAKQTKNYLENFQTEIETLPQAEQANYLTLHRSLKQQFDQIQSQFEQKQTDPALADLIQRQGRVNQRPEQMTELQMIQEGNRLQKDGTDIITGLISQVDNANDQADDINMEIANQSEKLDRMYNTVQKTQTEGQRMAAYIRHFAKQAYQDQFLMCLIMLIFIAIVVIIILSAMGFNNGNFVVPDQVKPQNNSTVTTTSSATTTTTP